MSLIQLTTLKARLGLADADVRDDDFLTAAIAAVTSRFDRECNRSFARSAAATFDFPADELNLVVKHYPIEEVTSFSLKTSEADGFVVQNGIDFLINETRSIIALSSPLGTARQLGRVTFAGGYVLPGATAEAGQTALPADLVQAAGEQVAYWFQNRDRLGLSSMSGQGGGMVKDRVSVVAPFDLLPIVMNTLKKYERWVN